MSRSRPIDLDLAKGVDAKGGNAKAGDGFIKESREMARAERSAEEMIEESRGTGEPTARRASADYSPQTAVQHTEASSATVKCGLLHRRQYSAVGARAGMFSLIPSCS